MAAREIAFTMIDSTGGALTFEQLLAACERPVLRLCYRLLGNLADAQDAAQEVFLRAHCNMSKFDGSRDPLPWLYHVAVNLCRDRHRRRRPSLALDHAPEPRSLAANPEQQASSAQQKQLVMEGLAQLAERERTALVLRDLEGLDTRDVAAMMGVTEETVRSHCSLARAKLRNWIEERTRA